MSGPIDRRQALKATAAGLTAFNTSSLLANGVLPPTPSLAASKLEVIPEAVSALTSVVGSLASGLEHCGSGAFTKWCLNPIVDDVRLSNFVDSIGWKEVHERLKADRPFGPVGANHTEYLDFERAYGVENDRLLAQISSDSPEFLEFRSLHHGLNPHRDTVCNKETGQTVAQQGFMRHNLTDFTLDWVGKSDKLKELIQVYEGYFGQVVRAVSAMPQDELSHLYWRGTWKDGTECQVESLFQQERDLLQAKRQELRSPLLEQYGEDWLNFSAERQFRELAEQHSKLAYLEGQLIALA